MQAELQERVDTAATVRVSAAVDLAIALAFFFAANTSLKYFEPILRRGLGLSGVLQLATFQFVIEGLALFGIMAFRHERFADYGFTRRNFGRSLALGLAIAFLYDLFMSWNTNSLVWIPFRRHSAIRMSLADSLPASVAGIGVTIFIWGFVEGFFGIFFARKINQILNTLNLGWRSPGAVGFGLFNGAIHLAIGQGWQGFAFSFLSGYGIAVVPAVTKNAWGGTLVQALTNAVGKL